MTANRWEGATRHSASQLLAGPPDDEERGAVAEAVSVLGDILANGPVAAKEVRQQATAAGVSSRTLDRAKAQLGVRAIKAGYESGWQWTLPTPTTTMETKDAKPPYPKKLASFAGSWRSSYSHAENEEERLASFAGEERQALASFVAEERQGEGEKTASDQEERQVCRSAPTFWDREELASFASPPEEDTWPRCSACSRRLYTPASRAAGICRACRDPRPTRSGPNSLARRSSNQAACCWPCRSSRNSTSVG